MRRSGVALLVVAASLPCPGQETFRDSFENDRGWFLFEELVGGSPCYAAGAGTMARSTERAYMGRQSLQLWANEKGTRKSNHLIAVKRLGDKGRGGRWVYTAHVFVPDEGKPYQTGPEISVQNTRRGADGRHLTYSAAVQYQANPNTQHAGAWAVWRKTGGGKPGWEKAFVRPIAKEQWHKLTLEFDFDRNRYGWFAVESEREKWSVDLSEMEIAGEAKHDEEAFAVTLEGENFWSNCGETGVFRQRFFYDDVSLEQMPPPAVMEMRKEADGVFAFRFAAGAAAYPLRVMNVLIGEKLEPNGACYLAYTAARRELLVMDETGEKVAARGPVGEELTGGRCRIRSSAVEESGNEVTLRLGVTWVGAAARGAVFAAARDEHGGNSGWVRVGEWTEPE
jgi:hypothetical protein